MTAVSELRKFGKSVGDALGAMAAIFVVLTAAGAQAQVERVLAEAREKREVEVIVRLKAGDGPNAWERAASVDQQRTMVDRAVRSLGARLGTTGPRVRTRFNTLPFVGMKVDQRQVLELMAMDEVEGIFINEIERKQETAVRENAAVASSVPSIDVADAWAKGYDGRNFTVAVIDGGFRTSHPMLAGKSVGDACFSLHDPTFNTFTKCPSGQTPEIAPGAASNCPLGSNRCNHGTHVASTAVGNDGTNFGVARGAKLMPIDVFSEVTSIADCAPDPAPCQLTDQLTVLKALDYVNQNAATYNVAAVNLSLGGGSNTGNCDTDPRRQVIEMLRTKGVAVVASAGNEGLTGKINAPACVTAAVAVGATNDGTAVASFTNFAATVDLMAPGVSITAASGQSDGFATLQGSSMAAPHVAGAFAVVRSALPTATVDDIERTLKTTGVRTTREDSGIVVPKIQVYRAILRLQGKDRREFANVLTAAASSAQISDSFLRFLNDSAAPGKVSVSLRDAETGRILGTWTSGEIPAHASAQFDIGRLEANARDAANASTPVVIAPMGSYLNLQVESTFAGYMQHIVWARGPGALTNLSACSDGLAADNTVLMNVHTSGLTEYPSRIRIANSGTVAGAAELAFYNAATGVLIAKWNSPLIPAGGSTEVTVALIEALTPVFAKAVAEGTAQVNVRLGGIKGHLQHLIQNTRVGVALDMSAKCELGAVAAAAQ